MDAPSLFASDPSEDLALFTRDMPAPEPLSEAQCRGFEFSSRGDRVPGRLLLPPASEGPLPLILLQNAEGSWGAPDPLDAAAAGWLAAGAAVASIDLPLHGTRASAKLSERLLAALGSAGEPPPPAPPALDPIARLLRIEFTRQAVADLGRALEAAGQIASIDGQRVAFLGFGVGATVGTLFCAVDPRPGAVVLAPPPDPAAPAEVAPCSHVAEIAPRPLLLLDTDAPPDTGAEALFKAAREPKSIEPAGGNPAEPSAAARKALDRFLEKQLRLSIG